MITRSRRFSVLAAAGAILLAACSAPSTSSPTPPTSVSSAPTAVSSPAASGPKPTLKVDVFQKRSSFFPWNPSGTAGDLRANSLHWDVLGAYLESGEPPTMRLAESVTPSADAKTWTVKLKPGIRWSDGTPFTSKDVLFTWKIAANPNQSYFSGAWSNVVGVTDWQKGPDFSKDIPGITAPDPNTVVFSLIQPAAGFLPTLLSFRVFMLPEKAMLAAAPDIFSLGLKAIGALPFWTSPTVGIGPYIWDQTQTDQFTAFRANPNWRGRPLAFSRVILTDVTSTAVAASHLQSGDLDVADVALDDLPALSAAGFQVSTQLSPAPIITPFNMSPASRFNDVRLRQAFMYGCDRQGFVDTFLKGKGKKTDTYFFPSWVPKNGIKDYSYKPQTAKSLLDAAKFDYSKPVTWLSPFPAAADRVASIQLCQSQMATIGVKIDIVSGLEVTTNLRLKGQWDLYTYGGNNVDDPNDLQTVTTCAGIGKTVEPNGYKSGGQNFENFCDPQFDKLMTQASTISGQSQRGALYAEAQNIFLEAVPIMMNYIPPTAYASGAKIHVVPNGQTGRLFYEVDQWSKVP